MRKDWSRFTSTSTSARSASTRAHLPAQVAIAPGTKLYSPKEAARKLSEHYSGFSESSLRSLIRRECLKKGIHYLQAGPGSRLNLDVDAIAQWYINQSTQGNP